MPMLRHKIVSLDTATWAILTRDQTPEVQRIHSIFLSGEVIPFFTNTVVIELLRHGDEKVVEARDRRHSENINNECLTPLLLGMHLINNETLIISQLNRSKNRWHYVLSTGLPLGIS